MAWLALPLIFLIPGYLTLAAWRGSRTLDVWKGGTPPKTPGLPAAAWRDSKTFDFWEGLFLVPFISILLSSWIGFVLAETGFFSLAALSLLLGFYCLAVALLARRRLRLSCLVLPGGPPFRAADALVSILLVAILAVAAWAYSRPAEVVSGTFDPGIYLSTGASIARTGSIAFQDPFVAQLRENLRPYLLERRGEIGVGEVRLPAFWLPEPGGDRVIPAFFHLYPVWLAIMYSVGAVQASLFVSPIFGLLGVWAFFLLGRRLAGPAVGLLASGLLALNPAQVWFSRYPLSEITVQMLLLGGLALWVLWQEKPSRLLAFLGGSAFGLVHLAKVDQVFLPAAIFLSLFLLWLFRQPVVRGLVPRPQPPSVGQAPALHLSVFKGELPVVVPPPRDEGQAPALHFSLFKEHPSGGSGPLSPWERVGVRANPYVCFLLPYSILLAHSLLHVYFFSFAYTWINLGPFLRSLTSPLALALYATGAASLAAAVLARPRMEALRSWLVTRRRSVALALTALVGLAAIYGYLIWPLTPDPNQAAFLSSDGVTPVYLNLFREEGLVRLGWYLSALGLLLGLIGLALFTALRAGRRSWPLLILFTSQLVFHLLTAGLAYPVHFWAIRRYVPLVIPAFVLFAAFAIAKVWPVHRKGEPPARPYSMADGPDGLKGVPPTRGTVHEKIGHSLGRGEPAARPHRMVYAEDAPETVPPTHGAALGETKGDSAASAETKGDGPRRGEAVPRPGPESDRATVDSTSRLEGPRPWFDRSGVNSIARSKEPLPPTRCDRFRVLANLRGLAAPVYLRYLVAAVLVLALEASSFQTTSRFLWQTEYQGALDSVGRWAGKMDDPALVLFKPRMEGNIFSTPLQNLYGKTGFILQREPDKTFYSHGIERWLGEGWAVYLVLGDRYPRYLSGDITYNLVDGAGLELRAMEQAFDRLPRETLPMSFPLRLYRLQPASGYPYVLNMGPLWTEATLALRLPQPTPSKLSFRLRAWSGGPSAVPVSLSLDGRLQQTLLVEREARSYEVSVPIPGPAGEGQHELSLSIDPTAGAGTGGIMLEWVEVVKAGAT